MSGGFNGRPCVRLRALDDIRDGSELLTFYSADYFGDGNVNCLCGHDDLHHEVKCTQESSSTAQKFRTSKRRRVLPRVKLFRKKTECYGNFN